MPGYRLYSLSPLTGHIEGVEEFHAVDDVSAIGSAQKRMGAVPLELWRESRKIARLGRLPSIDASLEAPSQSQPRLAGVAH